MKFGGKSKGLSLNHGEGRSHLPHRGVAGAANLISMSKKTNCQGDEAIVCCRTAVFRVRDQRTTNTRNPSGKTHRSRVGFRNIMETKERGHLRTATGEKPTERVTTTWATGA